MTIITIPGPPRPWQRTTENRAGRRCDTARNKSQKEAVAWAARAQRLLPVAKPAPVLMGVCVYLDPSDAHVAFPTRQADGDCDNYAKLVLDALGKHRDIPGLAFDNDAQVISAWQIKTWMRAGEHPRTVVYIAQWPERDIFASTYWKLLLEIEPNMRGARPCTTLL